MFAHAVSFHKSGGDALAIARVELTFFASPLCFGNLFVQNFSTPGDSSVFTLPTATNLAHLNSSSLYQVAENSLGAAQVPNVGSVLVRLSSPSGEHASFTASTCNLNGDCCVPVTCTGSTCTNTTLTQPQDFTLDGRTSDPQVIGSSDPLLLQPGATGSLVITNYSSQDATNITASNLPIGVTVNDTACDTLPPHETCNL